MFMKKTRWLTFRMLDMVLGLFSHRSCVKRIINEQGISVFTESLLYRPRE